MNLIIFCTTMGHSGRYTHEETIRSILSQGKGLFDSQFSNKIVHLKTKPDQIEKAIEIKKFCDNVGFEVVETIANVVHHSENHQHHSAEYFKDIFKVYSIPKVRLQEYSLWLEDDWIIKENGKSFYDACMESIYFLDHNPDQLCVRFNSATDFLKCEQDHFVEDNDIFTQGKQYTQWGPTFTFQPNISRTKEIYAAWKAAQKHLDMLGQYHCELMSGDLLKNFSESETPFSFYNPEKIYAEHIG